ncbi:MAG: Glycosyl transferase, family 2, partial [Leptospirillum sp. Group IV 'UBA BS']
GRYIALLDGDDLMKPDRLEKQYQASLAHPEALLFSSSYEIFVVEDGKKNFFSVQKDIHLDWVEMVFKSQKDPFLRSFYVPLPSTIFFERNKVLDLGGFDTFFDTRPGEDIFFAVNNWSKGKFFHVNEVLLSYRAKARNLKNKLSKSWVQRTERQDRIIRTLYALYGDSYPEIHKSLRKLRAFWLRENSLNYFSCREGKKFGDLLLKRSLLDDPFSLETWKMVVKRSLPERFYPKLFWFDRWESLPSQVNHEFIVRTFGLRGARKESDKNDYKVSCP